MISRLQILDFSFYSAKDVEIIAEFVLSDVWQDSEVLPLMVTPNVDQIVKLNRKENAELKIELQKARWILPDGQPIVALSKIKFGKKGLRARLTGSDFFPIIWKKLREDESKKVLCIIPREDLGLRLEKERRNTCSYAPPFFKLENRAEFELVMSKIMKLCTETSFDFVFVGLGFPKQEHIALEMFKRLKERDLPLPKTFLLGASFEFYLGTKKRAPKLYQKLGIEFVYRAFTEPRRIAKRAFWDDLPFFGIAIAELRKKD